MQTQTTPGAHPPPSTPGRLVVQDAHARLNATPVARLARPRDLGELCAAVRAARRSGLRCAVFGGRHALGGQAFAERGLQIDAGALDRVLAFDPERGRVTLEAGIQWPALLAALARLQPGGRRWGIRQKQTGTDRLSLGGALSANIHGRGLGQRPFVDDVEGFVLVDPEGNPRRVDRARAARLFAHAVGGYGLFGPVHSVELRLKPLEVLERRVERADAGEAVCRLEERAAAGATHGDFQFSVDPEDAGFLRRGVLSTYRPVDEPLASASARRRLARADWKELLRLAHVDKRRAFERYARHYESTHGQLYDSDEMQTGFDVDDCHVELECEGAVRAGSEMITELYVPRPLAAGFLAAAADDLRRRGADCIYGTLRLVEPERETVLAWAREPWACIVLNLHVDHDPAGLARARAAFGALIRLALERGGTYYLTYHRWATREQLLAGHPRLPEFLAAQRAWDPEGRFQSVWSRRHLVRESPRAAG